MMAEVKHAYNGEHDSRAEIVEACAVLVIEGYLANAVVAALMAEFKYDLARLRGDIQLHHGALGRVLAYGEFLGLIGEERVGI